MHLKSISIKGFKSFPDRTRLDFGEGVSVVVGPNGSGKSNITDAVLWALGEQSPLAVRGQSMQDVIFAGGRGVQARNEAEVELVLDNADGTIDLPATELSVVRRLNRSGDGEYRLNGARCRLVDVLEVLSDTGMGKEAHSVISQGRVESIVTSKPRDRRLLIEEAAGLGKHRKRRRRAQLKLERTQENLDRLLDIEREARARLRPLKRQAEAAELHQRLQRQSDETRWQLAADELRVRADRLAAAEATAAHARAALAAVELELTGVAGRREAAEQALTERSARHEELSGRVFAVRAAADRVALRRDAVRALNETLAERSVRRAAELEALRREAEADVHAGTTRIDELEAELNRLDADRSARLTAELAELEAERLAATARTAELEAQRIARDEACTAARRLVDAARQAVRDAERDVAAARREAARVGAELAAVNQFLTSHAAAGPAAGVALDSQLTVAPGYELAVAAALGGRLGASVVADRSAGLTMLDRSGGDGGRVLVRDGAGGAAPAPPGRPPVSGAQSVAELLDGPIDVLAVAGRLVADAWVVDDLALLPAGFRGTAVTRSGRVWLGAVGELRQVAEGGRERALEQRNRRDALVGDVGRAAAAERAAVAAAAAAELDLTAGEDVAEAAEAALRDADRARSESLEHERRAAWLIDQRRAAPQQGELAVRRAQLAGELSAERRAVERIDRERRQRAARIVALEAAAGRDAGLQPVADRLLAALKATAEAIAGQAAGLEERLQADREAGEGLAAGLRACAAEESALQAGLRERGEAVTVAEVEAQQSRDRAAETRTELGQLAERLGLPAEPAEQPLADDERAGLRDRVNRLARRREQLGPVNPLAADEYREAQERATELEEQRTDLETALRELRALIRDTDRQITESFEQTFTAAARNFEELVDHVFPGGRGRLRLVRDDAGPRPVLGGQVVDGGASDQAEQRADAEADAAEAAASGESPDEQLGVEIEVTPAGKSMKRLSLLSGGEKSMTAIAFLFAVFLARPCPFYILDEVEAALDDLNIDRFLTLLRRYSKEAQFIVVTHQKRTMEAADWLYGVSMGGDGVSKVVSRRLGEPATADEALPWAATGDAA